MPYLLVKPLGHSWFSSRQEGRVPVLVFSLNLTYTSCSGASLCCSAVVLPVLGTMCVLVWVLLWGLW